MQVAETRAAEKFGQVKKNKHRASLLHPTNMGREEVMWPKTQKSETEQPKDTTARKNKGTQKLACARILQDSLSKNLNLSASNNLGCDFTSQSALSA